MIFSVHAETGLCSPYLCILDIDLSGKILPLVFAKSLAIFKVSSLEGVNEQNTIIHYILKCYIAWIVVCYLHVTLGQLFIHSPPKKA